MNSELQKALKRFFEILETTEVSGMSEREFHPVTINSCRVLLSTELDTILPIMKKYSEDSTKV